MTAGRGSRYAQGVVLVPGRERFKLGAPPDISGWRLLVDTARALVEPNEPVAKTNAVIALPGRVLVLYEGVR